MLHLIDANSIQREARTQFPTAYGRAPRDIVKYKLQAGEWMNWVTIFSPIFLKGRLPEPFYQEWISFAEALTLMRKWDLTNNEINTIERLTIRFVEHYEAEYYQYQDKRLAACKATFHYLLHIAQSIRDCGPPGVFWQFPMERQCGFLGQAVKSRANANRNLSLCILYSTQLHFLAIAYPLLDFTELVVDREDKAELQILVSNRENIPAAIDPEEAPNRVLTVGYYASLGIALSHFHKNGPQRYRKLTKAEYKALTRMLASHDPRQLRSIIDSQEDLTVTKFSNCWKGYEKLGSVISLTSSIGGRSSSIIRYISERGITGSLYGKVLFFAHIKIIDVDWMLAFVERSQVGRVRGQKTLFVVEQPSQQKGIDCISTEGIVCSMGLLRSSSRLWLCTRTSALF